MESESQQTTYDSSVDTLLHIKRVSELLGEAAKELLWRAANHDSSKLRSPEKELFDKYTPLLAQMEYGSEEYKQSLSNLKPALDHHYAVNTHHSEHYSNGINGMNLFDIVEMFLDWIAATERNKGGDIRKSIVINKDRYDMSKQLVDILENTVNYLRL